jgi:hypothetical protein
MLLSQTYCRNKTILWKHNIVNLLLPSPLTGLHGEGWFDPHSLLAALKKKNISLGVQYINAEVIGFTKRIDEKGISDKYMLSSVIVSLLHDSMYHSFCAPSLFTYLLLQSSALAKDFQKTKKLLKMYE